VDSFAVKGPNAAQALSGVSITRGEAVSALRSSGVFFIQTFLGEELAHDVPDFHLDSWELMTRPGIDRVALALPRSHAKTTLAKLACVWHFLFTEVKFIVYASNTALIAVEACKDIINYMRSPNFVALFGNLEFAVERDGSGFYEFRLRYTNEFGVIVDKTCILRAVGANQQVRGMNIRNQRPQLAVIDDLEDDDNTATELLQKKLFKWMWGPFIKALALDWNKVIFLGNMLSNKSILHELVERAPDWWSRRFGCIKADGTPLWPDVWDLSALKADLIRYQRMGLTATWFAEMMNMPMADGQGLIDANSIGYTDFIVPGQQEAAFITLDPAISRKVWADDSALVVHALRNGKWIIAEYIVGKYTPDELFQFIVMLSVKWNTRVVGIEAAGYQESLQFLFRALMIMYNQQFDIYEIPHKNRTKTERLVAWCALIRSGVWALMQGDYAVTEQLLAYDPLKEKNKDDLIDSCSMGVTMVNAFLPAIMDQHSPVLAQKRHLLGLAAYNN